jgi:hypothetical protein
MVTLLRYHPYPTKQLLAHEVYKVFTFFEEKHGLSTLQSVFTSSPGQHHQHHPIEVFFTPLDPSFFTSLCVPDPDAWLCHLHPNDTVNKDILWICLPSRDHVPFHPVFKKFLPSHSLCSIHILPPTAHRCHLRIRLQSTHPTHRDALVYVGCFF